MDYRRAHERQRQAAHRNSADVANDQGSLPGKALRDRQAPGSFEKSDGFLKNVDHAINFFAGAVEIKTGAGRPGHAKPSHQRLIAMMTTAHGETVTIGKGGEIVRMRRLHHETDDSAAVSLRSNHSQPGQFFHLL